MLHAETNVLLAVQSRKYQKLETYILVSNQRRHSLWLSPRATPDASSQGPPVQHVIIERWQSVRRGRSRHVKLGSFHSVNFSDWKHVRFHSMALSDDLLLQILPVREVDGLVARTYHSVSRYRRTVSNRYFQSAKLTDCKRAHYPSVETSTDRKYGHFQSAKLTDWKERRFQSLGVAKHRSP